MRELQASWGSMPPIPRCRRRPIHRKHPSRSSKNPPAVKPGGQPGHPGASAAALASPTNSKKSSTLFPTCCGRCQASLTGEPAADDPEPVWHQVAELPPRPVEVTEYQAHGRTCGGCGTVTWAKIPDDGACPRLWSAADGDGVVSERQSRTSASVALKNCRNRRRSADRLGTVANLEQEMSAALAVSHAEARQAVQDAAVKHVDETGWKQAGQRCWLWAAATLLVACFVIHPSRGAVGLVALLGTRSKGSCAATAGRSTADCCVRRRQVCWAHLKRDFQKLVDRGGAAQAHRRGRLGHRWSRFRLVACFSRRWLGPAQLRRQIAGWRTDLSRPVAAGVRLQRHEKRPGFVKTCWLWSRPCGPSWHTMAWRRLTITSNGCCVRRCCGARMPSAAIAKPAAASSNAS